MNPLDELFSPPEMPEGAIPLAVAMVTSYMLPDGTKETKTSVRGTTEKTLVYGMFTTGILTVNKYSND